MKKTMLTIVGLLALGAGCAAFGDSQRVQYDRAQTLYNATMAQLNEGRRICADPAETRCVVTNAVAKKIEPAELLAHQCLADAYKAIEADADASPYIDCAIGSLAAFGDYLAGKGVNGDATDH